MAINPMPCRSCRAAVFFVRSAKTSAYQVLDAEPVADGNIVILDDLAHVCTGDLFEEKLPDGLPKYKSHFATCPDSDKHRKKK